MKRGPNNANAWIIKVLIVAVGSSMAFFGASQIVTARTLLVVGVSEESFDERCIPAAESESMLLFAARQENALIDVLPAVEGLIFVDAGPQDFAVPAAALPHSVQEELSLPDGIRQQAVVHVPEQMRAELYVDARDCRNAVTRIGVVVDAALTLSREDVDADADRDALLCLGAVELARGTHSMTIDVRVVPELPREERAMPRMYVVDSKKALSLRSRLEERLAQPGVTVIYYFRRSGRFYVP